MSVWYYGYADKNGLDSLIEDEENLSLDLFGAEQIKKEISIEKKKAIWAMITRSKKEPEMDGVVFRLCIDDELIPSILEMKARDPLEALNFLEEKLEHLDFSVHGTTLKACEEKWKAHASKYSPKESAGV